MCVVMVKNHYAHANAGCRRLDMRPRLTNDDNETTNGRFSARFLIIFQNTRYLLQIGLTGGIVLVVSTTPLKAIQ